MIKKDLNMQIKMDKIKEILDLYEEYGLRAEAERLLEDLDDE